MKEKWTVVIGLMICLILILALPSLAIAVSDRPKYDEQGNFVPNQFADNDAARYGGLFGPLQAPDPWENMAIGYNNPELVDPFGGLEPNSRDIGFATGERSLRPINTAQSHYD